MPDLFPGMDPYIEARGLNWPNFQLPFIVACSKLLNQSLPKPYAALVDGRPLAEDFDGVSAERFDPFRKRPEEPTWSEAGGYWTLPQFVVPCDGPTAKLIRIEEFPHRHVVTEIHLLTACDKRPGEDRSAYLANRRTCLHHDQNSVEVDLLLAGDRLPLRTATPKGDYHAYITRAFERSVCEVYSWSVRDALPTISVPLKDGEPDVPLDLAAAHADLYEDGYREVWLRYDEPPADGLSDADRAWAIERASDAAVRRREWRSSRPT